MVYTPFSFAVITFRLLESVFAFPFKEWHLIPWRGRKFFHSARLNYFMFEIEMSLCSFTSMFQGSVSNVQKIDFEIRLDLACTVQPSKPREKEVLDNPSVCLYVCLMLWLLDALSNWNRVMMRHKEKYYLNEYFHSSSVFYEILDIFVLVLIMFVNRQEVIL